ncbi:MAG: ABC transporter permease [Variibacter sp.]|nr:ABC transporter permease [Variibacter sp.]
MKRVAVTADPVGTTFAVVAGVTLFAITAPLVVTVITAFNAGAQTEFPPSGWSLRWFANVFKQSEFVSGFWLSIALALCSGVLATVLGTLGAVALSRGSFRGREILDGLLMSPLIVPQVIIGLAFLIFFVRVQSWSRFGDLLLLHGILTLPYAMRVVRASLARVDPRLEEAAIGLGASRLTAFLRITLPQIQAGLFVAMFFAFVVSFDNFTATAFLLTSNATLPLEIFFYIESQLDPTVSAVASLMMLGTTLFVLLVDRLVGINRVT